MHRSEEAFEICGFWAAEHLARGGGSLGEAEEAFERALDAGLLGEEVDPKTLDPLGSFPQGFTHLGLVNAALSREERAREERARGEDKGKPWPAAEEGAALSERRRAS